MDGRGHGEKLTRTMERAIARLLTCRTIGEAATAAKMSEKTLRNWLKLPDFQAAYRCARRQVVEQVITQLQRSTDVAVNALQRNLKCGHAGTEVRAALGILDQSIKAIELMDLEQRVAELEQAAAHGNKR